ncbi:uncharacterized protein PAC_12816 [Phialocephala subalpina]|uniref:Uncharacterized protein n=1 Tax=Phialocephala subalpina TaxID=576137 RepID=A0A1L7XD04_9HELO|nr:uncharacterized protein PAC_12816 [Phialocephala subalpina]
MPTLFSRQIPQALTPLQRIQRDNGYAASVLARLIFSSVIRMMDRVEKVVLPETSGFLTISFKTSFASDYTMTSLTGTIMVQVSIIALSLRDLTLVHWTATFGFIISLIFGCLSVWMSVKTSHILTGLSTPDAFRHWLSLGSISTSREEFERELEAHTESIAFRSTRIGIVRVNSDFRLVVEEERTRKSIAKTRQQNSDDDVAHAMILDFLEQNRYNAASFYSCAILSAPAILLKYSLVSFFAGLGIYASSVWQVTADPGNPNLASLAFMICCFVGLATGFALFFMSALMNNDEPSQFGTVLHVADKKETEKQGVDVESGPRNEYR